MEASAPQQQQPYPVTYEVDYPERLSRGKIFYKWLIALPHYLALSVVQPLSYLALIVWFFLFLRRPYPWPLFNLVTLAQRWNANVTAYVGLLRDEYPPFAGDEGYYPPVRLRFEYPGEREFSRPLLLFKTLILAIPHYIVLAVLWLTAFVVIVIAWFAILFTGRFPRGMFDFVVGVQRWTFRVVGYAIVLNTDRYPPFSLE
jgi:hypothetical protein